MHTIKKGNSNIEWFSKKKCYGTRTSEDIVLSLAKGGISTNGKIRPERVVVHFHNKSAERITSTGFVVFGIEGDYLYFREAESGEGFKITTGLRNATIGTSQCQEPHFVEWARNRRSGYSLHKDENNGMYYIEAKPIE